MYPQKKRLRSFYVAEPLVLLRKIIADVAVAFLLVASFHLPVVHGPGRDRLQARDLVAAAVAAGVVAAEAADPEQPGFFLVGRALHPHFLHQPGAGSAAGPQMGHGFHAADVRLRPEVAACRTADAQVHRRYPAAKSVLLRHAPDLAVALVVALAAAGHVAAAATVRLPDLVAV